MKKLIGYSDFIRICKIDDPKSFIIPGLVVKEDGVWVDPDVDDVFLGPEERAVLYEHPKKDLTVTALSFPCSFKQFNDFFDYYGLHDFVNDNLEEKNSFF